MALNSSAILELFKKSGALLEGHFVLRSGLHSSHFFQCARLGEHLDIIEQLVAELLAKWEQSAKGVTFDTVLAPAIGALVLGQELARQAKKRFIFAEKDKDGRLELRRGFQVAPGERVLVVEDVVTRGGRIKECIAIVDECGGKPVGVTVLVDRSRGKADLNIKTVPLICLDFPTFTKDALPSRLQSIPAVKPGS